MKNTFIRIKNPCCLLDTDVRTENFSALTIWYFISKVQIFFFFIGCFPFNKSFPLNYLKPGGGEIFVKDYVSYMCMSWIMIDIYNRI